MDSWIAAALPGAVAYAASLLGDRVKGQDVVQDCVCRLLAQGARYDLQRDGRKLLFRAITNACINHRSRDREPVSLDNWGRSEDGGTWEIEDVTAATPVMLAMAAELREAITQGLQSLPLRQQATLELASLGYPPQEIAAMLAVEVDHVRVLLFRARKAMAALLNERFCEKIVP